MQFLNATRMVAGYTIGMAPSGRESLVVVVKGTFRIPDDSGAGLRLHEEQAPLVESDIFFGAPGLSAPRYESDFAPGKTRCDLLLNGHAYAPGGRPTERVEVQLRVGNWSKAFSVVGHRVWHAAGATRATSPEPFTTMPISYDRAFGGTDLRHEDPAQHAAFMPNPSGRGFHRHLRADWLQDSPLPNTEEIGAPVHSPRGSYRPMSFGAIGRHWEPRSRYAGTYDQRWLDDEFPFLLSDFDTQYYQAAPADQQVPIMSAETTVTLTNLTPDGRSEFVLPHFEAPIYVFPKKGPRENGRALADTVVIEPDLERVTITWRLARPLRKNLYEIAQVLVGRKGAEWWQQREKTSFPLRFVPPRPSASGATDSGVSA